MSAIKECSALNQIFALKGMDMSSEEISLLVKFC